MPQQDRTGTKYEKLLAASLLHLDYTLDGAKGKNYLHPTPGGVPLIPGTYIQPDLVVRDGTDIKAILYSTHWSNTRDSKRKFWRTWEEAAQQKLILGSELLTINCVFEALPSSSSPGLYTTAEDLPKDTNRRHDPPIQLRGWDPGVGWALLEAFDVSVVFPVSYQAAYDAPGFGPGEHDAKTSELLDRALGKTAKAYFSSQWEVLNRRRLQSQQLMSSFQDTESRYRIGLLHLYLLDRLIGRLTKDRALDLNQLVDALADASQGEFRLEKLAKTEPFDKLEWREIYGIFNLLSQIYVRTGRKARTFCTHRTFSKSDGSASINRVRLNEDLRLCLKDVKQSLSEKDFTVAVQRAFEKFDIAYGVAEAIDDLADSTTVNKKEHFVREHFASALSDVRQLNNLLRLHSGNFSTERASVSKHRQNWVLEMLLFLAGLNSAEDIQTRFREQFEQSGHQLRPHAPYGGHAQTVAFLLQGRDVCEQWSNTSRRRTLTKDQFRTLCWEALAGCIVDAFRSRGSRTRSPEEVITKYVQNKSMRIVSSDLNGFYIIVAHYLGDLCYFTFAEDSDGTQLSGNRVLRSWQTDVVREIWGGRPLETWMEGMSRNSEWLIKVQSSQDGNEGHKTKELAGRCRGISLEWSHDEDPHARSNWSFVRRNTKKRALVLDGDWSVTRKKNLYEAGWDWVGDVAELSELRGFINT